MKYYQLLILGNGFDVHCGLQSRYKDFFRNALLDTIGEPFGLRQLRASVSGFWENLLLEYHKAYSDVDYKWCDIETIIKNTLISTFYIDKQMSICVWKNALQSTKSGSDSDDATKTIRNSIIQYIYKYCMRFFYNVLSQQKAYSDDELLQLLIAHILQELYNFEQRFCKYIKSNIVNPKNSKELNEKYIVNAMNLLATLTGFTDMRYENIDDIIEQQDEEYWEQLSPTMRQSAWRETHLLSQEYTNLQSTNILSFNYTARLFVVYCNFLIYDVVSVRNTTACKKPFVSILLQTATYFLRQFRTVVLCKSDIYVFKQNTVEISRTVYIVRSALRSGYKRFMIFL